MDSPPDSLAEPRLYDSDFALWLEEQADALRRGDLNGLDIPHLIEEIEGLAARDRKELQHRILTILEHLLKHDFGLRDEPKRGWLNTVRRERQDIEILLLQSPSLRRHVPTMIEWAYPRARERALDSFVEHEPRTEDIYATTLPAACPYDAETVLG